MATKEASPYIWVQATDRTPIEPGLYENLGEPQPAGRTCLWERDLRHPTPNREIIIFEAGDHPAVQVFPTERVQALLREGRLVQVESPA